MIDRGIISIAVTPKVDLQIYEIRFCEDRGEQRVCQFKAFSRYIHSAISLFGLGESRQHGLAAEIEEAVLNEAEDICDTLCSVYGTMYLPG